MNHERNPNNHISLDLSLGVCRQEEDPLENKGQFMQLLRSVSEPPQNLEPSPPSAHHLTPHGHYNILTTPWNVSESALLPTPLVDLNLLPAPPPYPQLPQTSPIQHETLDQTPRPVPRLGRPPVGHQARNSSRAVAVDKSLGDMEIEPPYPWATTKPAVIHNLIYLTSKNINVISGQVHCRPCDKTVTLKYNLKEKFVELSQYIEKNKEVLRQRAPNIWMYPNLTPCDSCQSGMKPVFSDKKEEINWLFLLLGQMLGSCTLIQLRYFCDKTNQHRTGAKDRVLYLTYLGLCKQLEPTSKLFNL